MSSRDSILERLRSKERPFPDVLPITTYLPMTPLAGDAALLRARFIEEAETLNVIVHQPVDEGEAIQIILGLLASDRSVLAWDLMDIPLPGLRDALAAAHISVALHDDPSIRVGISGANAALAATGSVVLCSGNGRYRATSLLPPVHIVVIKSDQILPTFEQWISQQKANGLAAFQQISNIVIVSGPSRTADIALELILGMHGPGELHIVILDSPPS